jgi:DNA-binding response OmpR family regulator
LEWYKLREGDKNPSGNGKRVIEVAKILVVEDDKELSKMIIDWLEDDNHTAELVEDGKEGLDRLRFYEFDLAILDWELPLISGPEVCRSYRSSGGQIPVLMLTGRSDITDKLAGFDAGADDYLTKPFHPRELSVRLRALLMRPCQRLKKVLVAGELELDPQNHVVTKAGQKILLAPREFALLEFFMRHPDEPFSPDALLDRIWSSESEVSRDLVKVYIARLRQKIDADGDQSRIITVHGVGYKLQS